MFRHVYLGVAGLALAFSLVPARAPAAIYIVGTGSAACTHTSIQDAVAAAAVNPGLDFIRITQTLNYLDQGIAISNQDLQLEGGWADCNAGSATPGARTVVSGEGTAASGNRSVFTVTGSGSVAFAGLNIFNGDEVTGSGFGGGIDVSGGPHAEIRVTRSSISGNGAAIGGGISVQNNNSGNAADVRLVIGDDVLLFNNEAGAMGGGIFCAGATVEMIGAGSALLGNRTSGPGGGMRVENCTVLIAGDGPAGNGRVLVGNSAIGPGGGISAAGKRTLVTVFTIDADAPTTIAANIAGSTGGGIDIGSSARVYGFDIVIEENIAGTGGGAVSVFDNDDDPDALFVMLGYLDGSPPGAVNCNPARRCNRISANAAQDSGGVAQPAAAVRIQSATDDNAWAEADLYGTRVEDNHGQSLIQLFIDDGPHGKLLLDGAVVSGNVVGDVLVHNSESGIRGYVDILASTIAGNTIGGDSAILGDNHLVVRRSIVWQPGTQMFEMTAGALADDQFAHVLASDLVGIPPSVTNFVADPLFVDLAGGDLHLQLASPAIDYAPATFGDHEADHGQRSVDLAGIDDEFGVQDLGAFERPFASDYIFYSDFDPS
jgi:hypothetical protein